jgi:nitrogen fixation protein FixH
MTQSVNGPRKITGWHVLAGFVAAFGVIITVNIVMAYKAISTFPGLEVGNSYVASQQFDKKRQAQESLNWTITVAYTKNEVFLTITDGKGAKIQAKSIDVLIGRTTTVEHDQRPELSYDGERYRANVTLEPGNWLIKVDAVSDTDISFEQRLDIFVRAQT